MINRVANNQHQLYTPMQNRGDLTDSIDDYINIYSEDLHSFAIGCKVELSIAKELMEERSSLEKSISDILKKNGINISKDTKITFAIDPFDYNISVEGVDDKNLKKEIENALNMGNLKHDLYVHVDRSLQHIYYGERYHSQTSKDIEDKHDLLMVFEQYTGYNINDLKIDYENRTLVNDKGEDVFAMYEKAMWKRYAYLKDQPKDPIAPQLTLGDVGTFIAMHREKMWSYIDRDLQDVPDKVLRIGFENGNLLDLEEKGYGKGQNDWVKDLERITKIALEKDKQDTIAWQKKMGIYKEDGVDKVSSLRQEFFEKINSYLNHDTMPIDPKLAAIKETLKQLKAQEIAIKIVKGEKLNPEELVLIKNDFPELYEKAKMVKNIAKNLSSNDPQTKILMLDRLNKLSKYDNALSNMIMNALT